MQFPLYDRLHEKYKNVRYKEYDMMRESSRINNVLRDLDTVSSKLIGETIYALIHHHERRKPGIKGEVAINGTLLPYGGGVQYLMTSLPPVLQQMIIILINELIDGSCPESCE